jgi:diguanylate cyclase (GGDEF)-like protein/PAS domain S-box-containing protein
MFKIEAHYKDLLDNLHDGVYFVDRERRILYWNKAAEKITGYSAGEVQGRRCLENILRHMDARGVNLCKKGCPLAKAILDGQPREAEIYCHHKAGHRLLISVRVAPVRDAHGVIVGAVESFSDNSPKAAILARMQELEKLAMLDPLTKLPNRRYVEISLGGRLEELRRYGWSFGVLSIDLDHFKRINDRYGHQAGDDVLKAIANTLVNNSRTFDVIGRWGGEEFIGLVCNVDAKTLLAAARRLRGLVEESHVPLRPGSGHGEHGRTVPVRQETLRITISIGATLATPDDTLETLLARADQLLYKSKGAGRNRVTMD